MTLNLIAQSSLIENMGWTLVHSTWQIAAVSIGLALVLRVLRGAGADLRYLISLTGLFLCVAFPVATFLQLTNESDLRSSTAVPGSFSQLKPDEEIPLAKGTKLGAFSGRQQDGWPAMRTPAFVATAGRFVSGQLQVAFPYVVGMWLLGIAFMSLRIGGGLRHLNKYKTDGAQLVDDSWRERFS